MALNDTETSIHIEKVKSLTDPLPCDYIDVELSEGDQPRFVLRPHESGGQPVGSPVVLEIEGIRALSAKLDHILNDGPKTGA
jgi:hypothetical protein